MKRLLCVVGLAFIFVGCGACASTEGYEKYPTATDGEWWFVRADEEGNHFVKIRCCDCGLTHVFQIEAVDTEGKQVPDIVAAVRAWRVEDLTEQARRNQQYPCICDPLILERFIQDRFGVESREPPGPLR
jgi:predicted nucleic-acid-binding Zn-ribbon protein